MPGKIGDTLRTRTGGVAVVFLTASLADAAFGESRSGIPDDATNVRLGASAEGTSLCFSCIAMRSATGAGFASSVLVSMAFASAGCLAISVLAITALAVTVSGFGVSATGALTGALTGVGVTAGWDAAASSCVTAAAAVVVLLLRNTAKPMMASSTAAATIAGTFMRDGLVGTTYALAEVK